MLLRLVFALCAVAWTGGAHAQDMTRAFQSACGAKQCFVRELSREALDSIVHYRAILRTEDDKRELGISRLVEERALWKPRVLPHAIFLLGQGTDSPLARWFATHGIDVWAAANSGKGEPAPTTADLTQLLAVARATRALTGSGAGKLVLLGGDRGAQAGYLFASDESHMPARQRSVSALVAIDIRAAPADPRFLAKLCAVAARVESEVTSGFDRTSERALTNLAKTAPKAKSPLFADLTNAEAIKLLASGKPYNPYASPNGAESAWALASLERNTPSTPPPEAHGAMMQASAVVCDDAPGAINLASETVPVLYVEAHGASILEDGLLAATLLAAGTETHVLDARQNDPALAKDVAGLVWQPILEWISAR